MSTPNQSSGWVPQILLDENDQLINYADLQQVGQLSRQLAELLFKASTRHPHLRIPVSVADHVQAPADLTALFDG